MQLQQHRCFCAGLRTAVPWGSPLEPPETIDILMDPWVFGNFSAGEGKKKFPYHKQATRESRCWTSAVSASLFSRSFPVSFRVGGVSIGGVSVGVAFLRTRLPKGETMSSSNRTYKPANEHVDAEMSLNFPVSKLCFPFPARAGHGLRDPSLGWFGWAFWGAFLGHGASGFRGHGRYLSESWRPCVPLEARVSH